MPECTGTHETLAQFRYGSRKHSVLHMLCTAVIKAWCVAAVVHENGGRFT